MLKNYLDEKSIEYKEKMVDQDEDARVEMVSLSDGFMGVPYTVIEKDGNLEKIIGFDRGKIDKILNL
jgi:glutaredoxin